MNPIKTHMTKKEAIEAMKAGCKVTHSYFTKEEWIALETPSSKIFVDETGLSLPCDEFWRQRKSEAFNFGWEIFA